MKPALYILFITMIISCTKQNDDPASNCESTMTKIAGTYSFYKFEKDVYGPGTFFDVTNDPSYVRPCIKDDRLILNANGTCSYHDLGGECSLSLDDNAGTWSLPSNGKIIFTFPTNALNFSNADITSFDCTTFVLTVTGATGIKSHLTLKK